MLALKQIPGISKRFVQTRSTKSSKAIANVLEHQCLNPIRDELPPQNRIESPYELSKSLNEIIGRSSISDKDASAIHNRLIEELCRHEYGISQIHAKKLHELGQPLSSKSILEIVKNNPGRVYTSWELLLRHGKSLALFSDDLLNSALENIVLSIQTKDDEAQNLASIVQSIILMTNLKDKTCIKPDIVEKLTADILDAEATCLLPLVLPDFNIPMPIFEQRMDFMTDYQIYLFAKNCPFDYLRDNEKLLLLTLDVLGKKSQFSLTEKELQTAEGVQERLVKLRNEVPPEWNVPRPSTDPVESAAEFLKLFEEVQTRKLDLNNLKLAKKVLRIFGVFRSNTKISLELYHSYLLRYPDDSRELMFETFLALAYQSYKTSNETLLQYAEVFIPDETSQSMLANIYRILILVKGRFDIEESLQLFNQNIESLNKENDSATMVAPAGLVSEALILAYLSQNQLEFARVIFEGSVREKIISGPTAIKRVKRYLALYGEAVEKGNSQEAMTDEVLKILRNI